MSHSKILWQDSFEMNIDIIDVQHKKLLELINEIKSDDTIFFSEEKVKEFIGKLKDYTKYHFDTEEKLMLEYQVPGFEEHKKFHEQLIQKLNQITTSFEDNPTELLKNINILLSEWFVDHILIEDKAIAQALSTAYNKQATERY